jgi:hypothetical protein
VISPPPSFSAKAAEAEARSSNCMGPPKTNHPP